MFFPSHQAASVYSDRPLVPHHPQATSQRHYSRAIVVFRHQPMLRWVVVFDGGTDASPLLRNFLWRRRNMCCFLYLHLWLCRRLVCSALSLDGLCSVFLGLDCVAFEYQQLSSKLHLPMLTIRGASLSMSISLKNCWHQATVLTVTPVPTPLRLPSCHCRAPGVVSTYPEHLAFVLLHVPFIDH